MGWLSVLAVVFVALAGLSMAGAVVVVIALVAFEEIEGGRDGR
jgi:hypothetical protein